MQSFSLYTLGSDLGTLELFSALRKSYVLNVIGGDQQTPNNVEAILEDELPDHLTLVHIAVDPPTLWYEQWKRMT